MQARSFLPIMLLVTLLLVTSCGEPDEPSQRGLESRTTAQPEVTTTVQHDTVDMAPLDNPNLEVTVYWLGYQFDPEGDLPALELEFVAGRDPGDGGPGDSKGELQYKIAGSNEPMNGITLQLWTRSDWEKWISIDPEGDDFATIFHMFWNSPCARRDDVQLADGTAIIYSSYQALADPAVTDCPTGDFDRFLGHAFLGDTVVTANAPFYLEQADSPYPAPYNSFEGVTAILRALEPRESEPDPKPLPTRHADLSDPGSLVLQKSDLPGLYSFGDDGCAPDRDCFIGPTRMESDGHYDDLSAAAGEVLTFTYQYEHVGFSTSGTPDPAVEPPIIYSQALICVTACDVALILEVAPDLLAYSGFTEAQEISTSLNLGDEARIFRVNTLVLGQVEPGFAIVWRNGPIISLLAIGGVEEEQGQRLAVDLAGMQNARVERALRD